MKQPAINGLPSCQLRSQSLPILLLTLKFKTIVNYKMGIRGRRLTNYEKKIFIDIYPFIKKHSSNCNHVSALTFAQLVRLSGQVRIHVNPTPPSDTIRGITNGKHIFINKKLHIKERYSHLSIFVHELVHVYQFRRLRNYVKIIYDLVRYRGARYHTHGCLEYQAELIGFLYALQNQYN